MKRLLAIFALAAVPMLAESRRSERVDDTPPTVMWNVFNDATGYLPVPAGLNPNPKPYVVVFANPNNPAVQLAKITILYVAQDGAVSSATQMADSDPTNGAVTVFSVNAKAVTRVTVLFFRQSSTFESSN